MQEPQDDSVEGADEQHSEPWWVPDRGWDKKLSRQGRADGRAGVPAPGERKPPTVVGLQAQARQGLARLGELLDNKLGEIDAELARLDGRRQVAEEDLGVRTTAVEALGKPQGTDEAATRLRCGLEAQRRRARERLVDLTAQIAALHTHRRGLVAVYRQRGRRHLELLEHAAQIYAEHNLRARRTAQSWRRSRAHEAVALPHTDQFTVTVALPDWMSPSPQPGESAITATDHPAAGDGTHPGGEPSVSLSGNGSSPATPRSEHGRPAPNTNEGGRR